MSEISFHLDIVTVEKVIFAERIRNVQLTGCEGELGIYSGHTPLLTQLDPGPVCITKLFGDEEILYISGGMLEVQPDGVTVMADTVLRDHDLDEERALRTKEFAQREIQAKDGDRDLSQAMAELAKALAQLRVIELIRRKKQ